MIQIQAEPVQAAAQEVIERHGFQNVFPFLKHCWDQCLIVSEDDAFRSLITAIRAEAFSISWKECGEELREAEWLAGRKSGPNFFKRAKKLADIDRAAGRKANPLAAIAEREMAAAADELSVAKQQDFSEFLRAVYAIKPIYYSLRDVWYECHFLTDDPMLRAEYNFKECIVDEYQADIGSLLLAPTSSVLLNDLRQWHILRPRHRRNRIKFWSESRVQMNFQMEKFIKERSSTISCEDAALQLVQDVRHWIISSISNGQRRALDIFMDLLNGQTTESG
jgi:hypothetical protein